MIKLQDFARSKGVTDRTIQKHLKKHENELQGHFQRKGKNGTWLDEFACSYLESLMITNPVVVIDNGEQQKLINELNKQINELNKENRELNKKLHDVTNKMYLYKDELKTIEFEKRLLENKTTTLEEDKRRYLSESDELKKELEEEKNRYQKSWFGLYKKVK